uniref:Uncharacterized protein n=1 Tax=viral metagenome TaxID=1070528 RepID=A0A6C0EA72_9ZZZZ
MNIGHSSRSLYDDCVYSERLDESVNPGTYRLQQYQTFNCDGCLSTLGQRSGRMGYGVSTPIKNKVAQAQAPELVNIESILSNRNLKKSRCRDAQVNEIDVTKYKLEHPRICSNKLNTEATHLSYPAFNYREVPINRFYNLHRDPQANIFWDFAVNTSLEEKDNYIPSLPRPIDVKKSLPVEDRSKKGTCVKCSVDSKCPM